MSEGIEAIKEVRKFLEKAKKCPTCGRSLADLVITDVPKTTLKQFKEFGNSEEFSCGDNKGGHWGFALKFLLDFYLGRLMDGSAIAEAKADEALIQLAELKDKPEEKKVIRTVDGKTHEMKR